MGPIARWIPNCSSGNHHCQLHDVLPNRVEAFRRHRRSSTRWPRFDWPTRSNEDRENVANGTELLVWAPNSGRETCNHWLIWSYRIGRPTAALASTSICPYCSSEIPSRQDRDCLITHAAKDVSSEHVPLRQRVCHGTCVILDRNQAVDFFVIDPHCLGIEVKDQCAATSS